jgi:hypothetical protein
VPHALGKGQELAGTQQGVSRGGKVRAEPSISKPYMAGNHKDIYNMKIEVSTVSAPVNSLGTLQTFNSSVKEPKGRFVNTVSSVNSKGSLLGCSDSSSPFGESQHTFTRHLYHSSQPDRPWRIRK